MLPLCYAAPRVLILRISWLTILQRIGYRFPKKVLIIQARSLSDADEAVTLQKTNQILNDIRKLGQLNLQPKNKSPMGIRVNSEKLFVNIKFAFWLLFK